MSAFDAILGYESVKETLRRTADYLRDAGAYHRLGARPARALLLYGEPGVGKTLMARCLIEESGRTAYVCRKDAPNGAFIEGIKNVFEEASQHAPSIVFLDDIDKFANEDERHRDAEEYVTVQSCIDALGDTEVFVLATANDIDKLPDSLLRQGRLGNKLSIECPESEDAEKIISHYLRSKSCVSDIDIPFVTRLLSGRSCAELEEIVNEAGLLAGYRRSECITTDDLLQAALRLVFEITTWGEAGTSGSTGPQERYVAYHEAGHVVVNEVLDPGSVIFATVLGGRRGSEGFALARRSDELDHLARMEADIIVSLGSRAAVEQRLGAADVGSASDLRSAAKDVRHLVTRSCCYGMQLQNAYYSESEAQSNNVEQVVAAELARYSLKAKEAVAKNFGLLDAVAARLIDRKVITMRDIEELARVHPITPVRW